MTIQQLSVQISSPAFGESSWRAFVQEITSGMDFRWLDEGILEVGKRSDGHSNEFLVLVELDTDDHIVHFSTLVQDPLFEVLLSKSKEFFIKIGSSFQIQ